MHQIRKEQLGELFTIQALSKSKSSDFVILCHGYGASAADLFPLASVVDPVAKINWIFPQAPIQLDRQLGGGYAWFDLELERLRRQTITDPSDFEVRSEEGFSSSLFYLETLIEDLIQQRTVDQLKISIGGFSQGSVVALNWLLKTNNETALNHLDNLLLFSSAPFHTENLPTLLKVRKPKRFLLSHGKNDPILPFQGGLRLAAMFQEAGWSGTTAWFTGGHEIPSAVLDRVKSILKT